jgi:quinol monooxygenase YgiN
MSATLIARQQVSEYEAWREVYNEADTIRARHGCTGASVLRSPKDHNLVFITHHFPTVEQAEAFTADPELHSAMARAGVVGDPGIEIFEDIV